MSLLRKLAKKKRWGNKCEWGGCRKQARYIYPEKGWYYCKIHGPKFEIRNAGKIIHGPHVKNKKPKRKGKERFDKRAVSYSYKAKKKVVTLRVLELRKKATWAERIFNDKMRIACPVKYKFQRAFIKGDYFAITDFYIPSRKLCIEIDGEYHNNPEQSKKDKHRDNWLRTARKLKVHRLTNNQAVKMTVMQIRQMLDRYI